MYQRDSESFPEYKILGHESEDKKWNELISVDSLAENESTDKNYKSLIKYAISQYSTVEDFLDNNFIKHTLGEIKEKNDLKKRQLQEAKANVEFVMPPANDPVLPAVKAKQANKSRKGGNKNRSQFTKKRV
jgi:hypothetical protein